MGTSASSNGPGSGISLDPAWLDDIDYNGADSFGEGQIDESSSDVSQDTLNTLNVAPRGRFSSARRNRENMCGLVRVTHCVEAWDTIQGQGWEVLRLFLIV